MASKFPRLAMAAGAPKEVGPLVFALKKKKKDGEDVGALVQTCLTAIG